MACADMPPIIFIVGTRGVEPPWITPHAPEACASTNFATCPCNHATTNRHFGQMETPGEKLTPGVSATPTSLASLSGKCENHRKISAATMIAAKNKNPVISTHKGGLYGLVRRLLFIISFRFRRMRNQNFFAYNHSISVAQSQYGRQKTAISGGILGRC